MVQWTVQPGTTVAGIKSFDKDTTVDTGTILYTSKPENFTWLDSNGAVMPAGSTPAFYIATVPTTSSGTAYEGYVYTITSSDKDAFHVVTAAEDSDTTGDYYNYGEGNIYAKYAANHYTSIP